MRDILKDMARKDEALPTQQFVDVDAVENGVLILRGGSLRQLIAVSGLNFDLKTEDEQNAITFAYQNFINSLNFTLQIFVHSRKVNIDQYVEGLKGVEAAETNPLLKAQVGEYREFIKSFVAENAIMHKSFYVVVPYDVVEIGGHSSANGLFGFLKKKDANAELAKAEESEDRARTMGQLAQRVDQVISGLRQIGLKALPLGDQEAIDLLYNLYNPGTAERKGLELSQTPQQPR